MFATSCSKDVANNITTSTISFSPDTLQEITAEDIWYPADSIYAEEFSVLSDSLLLIKNKRHDGPYLEVFNLKDSTKINSLLPYGSGPEEVIYVNVTLQDKNLQIIDPNRNSYANIPINQIGNTHHIDFKNYPQDYIIGSSINSIGGELFVQNLNHFISQEHNIYKNNPRFILLEPDSNSGFFTDQEYLTVNVGQGLVAVKPDEQKVLYIASDSSRIEIYNSKLQLEKVISGPLDLGEPKYRIIPSDDTNIKEVVYSGEFTETYYYCAYDNNNVVLLYSGQKWNPLKDNPETMPTYILVMDWDGNLKGTYKSTAHLFNISLSNNEPNVFYATMADEDNNPKPVKLTV